MFGKNPVRKQDLREDGQLRVQEVFKTLQGEGPFAGQGAIFVRLAGCNLRCHFCDTDFESGYANLTPAEEVYQEVISLASDTAIHLVVITGGEPLLQNCLDLIQLLMHDPAREWVVQFETAGTVWPDGLLELLENWGRRISLVCSPKTPKVHPLIQQYCFHWKYIIRHGEVCQQDGLPVFSTQHPEEVARIYRAPKLYFNHIYVQPCDEDDSEANRQNTETAIQSAMTYGYQLCLQLHKLVGLP